MSERTETAKPEKMYQYMVQMKNPVCTVWIKLPTPDATSDMVEYAAAKTVFDSISLDSYRLVKEIE